MKKLLISLLSMAIILGLSSCGQVSGNETSRLEQLRREFDGVGLAHNEALMLVYRDLAAEGAERRLTLEEGMTITDNCLCNTPVPSLNAIIGPGGANTFPRYVIELLASPGVFAKPAMNAAILDALSDSIGIIEEYKGIFDRIVNVLDSVTDTEAKMRELEQLYLMIDTEAEPGEDKTALMNGLSTLLHSIAYWDEHWYEWQETLAPGMQKSAAISIIGAIGIIDGAGAVLGTVEGFLETEPGEDGRAWTILKSAVMEGCKSSVSAGLSLILL